MKKIWGIFVILLASAMLVSCGSGHNTDGHVISGENASLKHKVKVNKKYWNKITDDAVIEYLPSETNFDELFPNTWHDFKDKNNYIIEGTIVNYEKMEHRPFIIQTKATIHVDKVIDGGKALENQYIATTFPTGFAFTHDVESSVDDQLNNKNTEVLYKQTSFPLPNIGSHVIMGINSNRKKFEKNKALKKEMAKYNLNGSNSYFINDPNYNFWIKNSTGKFVVNNLDIRNMKKNNPNYDKVYSLVELTKQLNGKVK
ncbi:hypothetical protein [Companilactobacillus insicii]|uniref:hypothetical protein n=1 Tax=Companilactobacillus insicii TaxID=1732567 RepID=UPI000F79B8BD|nr:hypothetical protein [Companilactobacillus insicii]